ncbi:MAG TPA: methyltransferase domain-containing protein [Aliidongia sp.]|uniref:class I SAM-dependent methyltransferase n=1 Tax=Aliidongia sp. TaxID=1914230 RepID=UPI002DDD0EFA|nr:methyltransferase domain-containing protein [Aliidongia sp.]HEV2678789.1 methyltransferase domain-containing protein [Aliidongia sp.]
MRHFLDRPVGWMPPDFGDVYDETSFWSARFGGLLLESLEIRRGICGLDVGCGAGFPLIELAQLHGPSSHFTGVDVWAEALGRARRKIAAHGFENVDVIESDAGSMPFRDGHFDLLVSSIGVNNFPDVPKALRECRRVAKAGARLVLTTNVRGHFGGTYRLLDEILDEAGLGAIREALRREEDHRSSKETLSTLLTASGFAVSRAVERSFTMRFADGSAMLRHSLVKWFLDGWREAVGGEHERKVFETLEARLDAIATRDGCVEMQVPMLYLESIAVS